MLKKVLSILLIVLSCAIATGQTRVYDETIDPFAQIDQAVATARGEGKTVICQLGGNWCPWCLKFAKFIREDDEIRTLIDDNYVYTHVNFKSRQDSLSQRVSQRLGNASQYGFPVLVVLNSDGTVRHIQESSVLEEEKSYNRDRVLAFFQQWTPTAQLNPFSLGADMGWCTQMEAEGQCFYNWAGEQRDAITLMKELGMDAIRLRVWVDPSKHGNWCDLEDNIVKARRAQAAGMDIMVDFHYSDWWADPGKQNIPAAWESHDYDQMRQDLRQHTLDVLSRFKAEGITPRWVQVGNETSNGMLWSVKRDPVTGWEIKDEHGHTTITQSMGHWQRNPEQYAGFFKAGAEAVKEVFPETKVIVHLDNGFDKELYVKNLDILRRGGCQWDIVGMSLYPYWALQGHPERTAQGVIDSTMVNIGLVAERYDCDVMIVETGFAVDEAHPEVMEQGREQLAQIIRRSRTETNGRCQGVFYWEPCCRPSMYRLGAFTEDGHPTAIMRAFVQ